MLSKKGTRTASRKRIPNSDFGTRVWDGAQGRGYSIRQVGPQIKTNLQRHDAKDRSHPLSTTSLRVKLRRVERRQRDKATAATSAADTAATTVDPR
jgi:hypothetical protein